MRRLLTHCESFSNHVITGTDLFSRLQVTESGIYTESDLKPFQTRLAELKQIITDHQQPEDEEDAAREAALTKLLMTKWEVCGERDIAARLSSQPLTCVLYVPPRSTSHKTRRVTVPVVTRTRSPSSTPHHTSSPASIYRRPS